MALLLVECGGRVAVGFGRLIVMRVAFAGIIMRMRERTVAVALDHTKAGVRNIQYNIGQSLAL